MALNHNYRRYISSTALTKSGKVHVALQTILGSNFRSFFRGKFRGKCNSKKVRGHGNFPRRKWNNHTHGKWGQMQRKIGSRSLKIVPSKCTYSKKIDMKNLASLVISVCSQSIARKKYAYTRSGPLNSSARSNSEEPTNFCA
jgi:hypothetical protein